ncbi:hypothetical protein E4188_23640 (plasmid) [Aeromonas media]|uniref:GtrA-like protein domain-containing protein n=1 Tax=Aeromonas media TaxID=651 RepID=A0ABX6P083_AERME|nr:hypothetical protein [Aeromonas media]ASI21296.1 hypothetical protein CE456_00105 [Aeromonas salmonicida]QJT41484.1 hypothetical protein E4188_23640 [Aeromonas media]HDN9427640.1 hypothetical protein [Aeromonas salmonicida]HDN9585321.1 hypothetical protein [Aeromonas salmonicida]
MGSLILGVDHRFVTLAFLGATVAAGCALRFGSGADFAAGYYALTALVMAIGLGCLYGGVSANYLGLSWQLFQYPYDMGTRARLASLLVMRRRAAIGLGFAMAMTNNFLMLAAFGNGVFSATSLGVLGGIFFVLVCQWHFKK